MVDPADASKRRRVSWIDQVISELATAQRGVVLRAQLEDRGVGKGAIDHRVAVGRLHLLFAGAYLAGHPIEVPLARETAAQLIYPGAALSHFSAGAFWRICRQDPDAVHLTRAGGGRKRVGIEVHRSSLLPEREIWTREGLRITSPAWTLLDLAEGLPRGALALAVNEAHVRGIVRMDELRRLAEGARGRRGAPDLLAVLGGGSLRTRSGYERRLLALIAEAELPVPETNVQLGRWNVDLLFRSHGLAVELDCFSTHGSPWAFERDRRKDAELLARGIAVLRITGADLDERPAAVVRRLVEALAARAAA